ncbi:MAG: DUF4157 domain-containing protein [Jatrophihabitantaceae bacterium]
MTGPAPARNVSVRIDSDSEAAPEPAAPAIELTAPCPAVAGLSRQSAPVMVGSADDRQEHAADAVASRTVAALREQSALRRQGTLGQHGLLGPAAEPVAGPAAPLAALRRQADRAVGRSGGPLPAPLADQLSQARAGGAPLAAPARAAFEQAMGADLSPVRVHAGRQAAELNRQVGAQAFTIGQDVFFAATPDLGTDAGRHLMAHELAHAVAPEAGGPVRRAVVTQLQVDKPDGEDAVVRISGVSIVGRPPPTFSSSMGDHSTAFTVHVNAVQLALIGHPLSEAAARMQDLVNGLQIAPGAKLVENLPPRQAAMWQEAYKRLVTIHGRLAAPTEGLDVTAAVQEYVAAYLELRELVPLSTINTGTVSKATSGKGKGEDCDALRAQAAGIKQSPDALGNEIVGLLDVRAVALSCIEPDPARLAALAPGLPAKLNPTERAQLFVEQHLRTIQTAFPGTLAALAEALRFLEPDSSPPSGMEPRAAARGRDELALPFLAPDLLHRILLPRARACLLEELPVLQRSLASLQTEIRAAQPIVTGSGPGKRSRDPLDSGKNSKDGQAALAKLKRDEGFVLARVNAIENILGLPLTPPADAPVSRSESLVPSGGRKSGRKPKRKTIHDPADVDERVAAQKHDLAVQQEMRLLAAPEPAEEDNAEELEEAAERKGYLAIQVLVGDDGRITEVRSAGRPPSPFSGTMGAHTTAWTVHVDRVRQLIVGSTIKQALDAVTGTLATERTEMADRLGTAFSFPESRPPARPSGSGAHDALVGLQNAIVAHLEAINIIPGGALSAADVGGKSEGKHRRVLLEHLGLQQYQGKAKAHEVAEVFAAIVGLLDVGSLSQEADDEGTFADLLIKHDKNPAFLLAQQHLLTIEASYPGALKAAGLTPTAASVNRVLRAAQQEKEKGKSEAKPSKRRKLEGSSAEAEPDLSGEDPAASKASVPDGGKGLASSAFAWDSSIFGKPPGDGLFSKDLDFTGSLLGGLASTLPGSGSEPGPALGVEWLDADGNLLPEQLPNFRAAYLADIARPGTYLAQAEGPIVADAFGIRVHVYRDAVPPGFTRIENVGGGNCLIHAASDIRAAMALEARPVARAELPALLGPPGPRAVAGGEILRIRGLFAAGLAQESVDNAVRDIVLSEVDGRGTPGLGSAMRRLLWDQSMQFPAAKARGKRRREKAEKSLKDKEKEKAKAKAAPEKPPVAPGPVLAPVILPQDTYGTGGPVNANYALLHTGGNHYVALIRTG